MYFPLSFFVSYNWPTTPVVPVAQHSDLIFLQIWYFVDFKMIDIKVLWYVTIWRYYSYLLYFPSCTSHTQDWFILHLEVGTSWSPSPISFLLSLPSGNHLFFFPLYLQIYFCFAICSCVLFLDYTNNWNHIVFVFLILTYWN